MLLARVEGYATATIKHRSLTGMRLVVVQPLNSLTGDPVIALDVLGAGVGQMVMITSDGKAARALVHDDTSPVRWSVVGLVDGAEAVARFLEGGA